MERHNQSFFGQKTAILFDSGTTNDAYAYFRFIKKNDAGWERPSENGGKAIKLSIQELICILDVLNGEKELWNTVHKYNSENTSLSFTCENRAQYSFKFSISCGPISYVKQIIYPESKFLRILLDHIIKEKIENATGYKPLSVQDEQSEELIPQGNSLTQNGMKKTENPRPQENKQLSKEIEKNPMENVSDFLSEIQRPESQRPETQRTISKIPENPRPISKMPEGQRPENPQSENPRPISKMPEGQRPENPQSENPRPVSKIPEGQRLESQRLETQKREIQENQEYTDLIASAKIITGKAVLLEVEPGNEFWVPKSAILKGNYDLIGTPAPFSIKSWVLKNRAINA